ncbi:hypothetical protein [Tritonibacter mobilis]|nr:hypothetical protein [Tritonibacter mobilis]NHM20045.1 hypothetical protein [Tritonibacter mobilis]NHM24209.1 hypothetical protein [Tritonibacter mobilis]
MDAIEQVFHTNRRSAFPQRNGGGNRARFDPIKQLKLPDFYARAKL